MEYDHCDRCGKALKNMPDVEYVDYRNGRLCIKCNLIRTFDYENPILYPPSH